MSITTSTYRTSSRLSVAKQAQQAGLRHLYHITHVDNLESIIQDGLLSHDQMQLHHYQNISNPQVQRWRDRIVPATGRRVHAYVPFYLTPKNPMLYAKQYLKPNLVILQMRLSVLNHAEVVFTDGNAASKCTRFFTNPADLNSIDWDFIQQPWWRDFTDGKRRKCAEVLIYPSVSSDFIGTIHFFNPDLKRKLSSYWQYRPVHTPQLFSWN